MRFVTGISRRQFGLLLGAGLVARPGLAHDGPHVVDVAIKSFAFVPDRVVIRAGDTVRWTNADIAPHTATAVNGDWDTGKIKKGASAEVAFDTPGTYLVKCVYHPKMKAEVIVEAE
ncbi:MAG: plastocyanin/azurin family copper-binding protein [Albidovulum sp.]